MMSIVKILSAVFLLGCAGSQPPPPQLATFPPVEPPPIAIELPPELQEPSAGDYLEVAFMQYRVKLWELAISSFESAIATGHLNDAGRVISYWHIGDCNLKLNNVDEAAEAFFSFVIIGDSVIEERETRRYDVDESGDFVQHFDLKDKIISALEFLTDVWDERMNSL